MNTQKIFIIVLVGSLLLGYSHAREFQGQGEPEPWPVPEKYQNMKNPVANDKESISIGKSLYVKHCRSCHGKEGLGDGTKAAELDTPPGDFTSEEFQSQSDGSLFYKTLEGRDDMPSFKKKITDPDEIWSIVNYVRTFE